MNNPPMNTEQQFGMIALQGNTSGDARANEVQNVSDSQKVLLKGESKVLGAIQLLIVVIHIILGILILRWGSGLTYISYYGISLWGIPFFLTSGALSVAIEKNPNPSISMIKAFQAMNIISAIESLGAIGVFCYDLYLCNYSYYGLRFETDVLAFLCVTNLLQFSITVSLATFGGRALAARSASAQQASTGAFVLPNLYTNATNPYGNSNPYSQSLQANRFQPSPAPDYPMMGPTQSGLQVSPALSQTGNDNWMFARNPTTMSYN